MRGRAVRSSSYRDSGGYAASIVPGERRPIRSTALPGDAGGVGDELAELGANGVEEAVERRSALLDFAERRLPEGRHVGLSGDGGGAPE